MGGDAREENVLVMETPIDTCLYSPFMCLTSSEYLLCTSVYARPDEYKKKLRSAWVVQ